MSKSILPLQNCEITPTCLKIKQGLKYEDWEQIGSILKTIEGAVQFWIGDWYMYGEYAFGEKASQALEKWEEETIRKFIWVSGRISSVRRRTNLSYSIHEQVAGLEMDQQEHFLDRAEKEKLSVRELRTEIAKTRLLPISPPPNGKYRCIVVDPPWPMKKIEREVRPRQKTFDYPTMEIEELIDWPVVKDIADENCHLYLWTTQKFLPHSFKIIEAWGFKYQCLLTWIKNVGFTPFSWMYSTEHVLFCAKGNLELLVKGQRLDFTAKVQEHSRKPAEFFNLVKKVSPPPRIDVFSREFHEGYEEWGNETKKFTSKD